MPETIIIASDGSEEAANAAKTAVALGVTKDANLLLVNALDLSGVTSHGMMQLSEDQRAKMIETCKAKVLEELHSELETCMAHKVKSSVLMHTPASGIVDKAEEEKASLIVIGRRGIGAIRAFFLGSVSQKVMEMTEIPVLIVPKDFNGDFSEKRHFLVTTDFSEHANKAVHYAGDLAAKLGASLTLLHVSSVVDEFVGKVPEDITEKLKETGVAEKVTSIELASLRELGEAIEAKGVSVDYKVAHGDVVEKILEVQKEIGANLVVMGSKGRNAVARFFVGSFTINVIKQSEVPVITM